MKIIYLFAVLLWFVIAVVFGGWFWLGFFLVVFGGASIIQTNSGGPADTWRTR